MPLLGFAAVTALYLGFVLAVPTSEQAALGRSAFWATAAYFFGLRLEHGIATVNWLISGITGLWTILP